MDNIKDNNDNYRLDLDTLYRLRAGADIHNVSFAKEQIRGGLYYLYNKKMKDVAIAYCGTKSIAEYLSNINNIADTAIAALSENEKLRKGNARLMRANSLF